MTIFDLENKKQTNDVEVYKIFTDFQINEKQQDLMYIDYFKVIKITKDKYKLIDCTKIIKSFEDVHYIKQVFELEEKETEGKIQIFKSLNDVENHIINSNNVYIDKDNYDKCKSLDYLFNQENCKNRIINKINYGVYNMFVFEYEYPDMFTHFISEVNSIFSRIAFIEKVESKDEKIRYRYTNKNFALGIY